ncbi:HEAT repeat domain-containing protein [Myxococcota bacterium]|nr:HEAT repeat domain-containing protein [Myxococcota bacterium]
MTRDDERTGSAADRPSGDGAAGPRANDPILGLPTKAKPLRVALYVLTVLSAAAALFVEPALAGAVQRGAISPLWLFTAIGVYGVFFLAYAVDRWVLVRRRHYPAGKAFFQIAFGLVFGLLLLPSTIGDYASQKLTGMERLLSHPDAEVREIAVEALGYRGFQRGSVPLIVPRLGDRDPRVAAAARRVLAQWSGKPAEDVAGIDAWASALSRTATVTTQEGNR